MKVIRRSRLFVLLPLIILGVLCANLAWDLVKINLDSNLSGQWPWRFNLLDVPTCATLVGIIAGLILTRAQFSKTMSPAIGWYGYEIEKSRHVPGAAWTVFLYNYGPGNCRVKKIEYSYALANHAISGLKTWDEVVDELASKGIMRSRDYHLKNIGIEAIISADTFNQPDSELAAFTSECLAKLSSMNVCIEVEDALGDTYGRTIECLRTAHKISEFRQASLRKKRRFRDRQQ